jgi:hypothetical protein
MKNMAKPDKSHPLGSICVDIAITWRFLSPASRKSGDPAAKTAVKAIRE